VLPRGVKELNADPTQAFPGQGQMKPEQLEIDRLRREVTKLKAERDILKKAAAYFAREPTGVRAPSVPAALPRLRRNAPLHRSEQVFTSSQSRAHFLRHANGRPQAAQIFSGRLDLV
jgi:transposase